MRAGMAVLAAAFVVSSASADPLEGEKSPAEILAETEPADWRALDPENTLYIELESGRVVVALSSVLAQGAVAAFKQHVRDGFYDGLSFYRVIDGFVAQGGDALGVRGEQKSLKAEFDEPAPDGFPFHRMKDKDGYAPEAGFIESLPAGYDPKAKRAWLLHCTGAIALGRDNGKDTASTEFYITLQPQRYLDRNLTVFGRVVAGMEHIQALRRVEPPQSKDDDLGDRIISMKIAADIPSKERSSLEILDSARPVFERYAESRRNRPEDFFYYRPDHLDICQLTVPARPAEAQ